MTTEQKALEMISAARKKHPTPDNYLIARTALCRAIEQHEAFRQEVSDVASVCAQHFCENSWTVGDRQDHIDMLSQFIIPAPKRDPMSEVWRELFEKEYNYYEFIAAMDARGLEIREKNDG